MARSPRSPLVRKGAFVLFDSPAWRARAVFSFQYNPESLHRRVELAERRSGGLLGLLLGQAPGGPASDAQERIDFELVFDATDDLEDPETHPGTVERGILPRLDALRAVLFPAAGGTALLYLSLGDARTVPARALELDVVEQSFSPQLHPLRARARILLEVLAAGEAPGGGPPPAVFADALASAPR